MGDRVAHWALDHLLDLRVSRPEPIVLTDDALARFVGHYRTIESEATFSIQDGGLRCVIKEIDTDLDHEQTSPPILLRPLSEREFVVTQDEHEGAQVDFFEYICV